MTSRRQERIDLEVQRAAYLCAERGLTQKEIGRLLGGKSQSRVSRLLKRAEDSKWLERIYRLVPDNLPPGRLEELRRAEEPTDLLEALARIAPETGVRVSTVEIVDSGSSGFSERAVATRLSRFGPAAVDIVDQLLLRSRCVAVTWGRSISMVFDAMKAETKLRSAGRGIRVLPICGEPRAHSNSRYTSSRLAEDLQMLLGKVPSGPPSLTGVPALIPRHFTGAAADGVRRFVAETASYREIFGGSRPLIRQVDTLLTSVGSSLRTMGFVHDELLRAAGTRTKPMPEAALQALVVGDIGGVLLPRPGMKARVASLNNMWTGAKESDFRMIATAAAKSSRPGVVVLSIDGDGRAAAIAAAIRIGLINSLVLDRSLADALTKELERRP